MLVLISLQFCLFLLTFLISSLVHPVHTTLKKLKYICEHTVKLFKSLDFICQLLNVSLTAAVFVKCEHIHIPGSDLHSSNTR